MGKGQLGNIRFNVSNKHLYSTAAWEAHSTDKTNFPNSNPNNKMMDNIFSSQKWLDGTDNVRKQLQQELEVEKHLSKH